MNLGAPRHILHVDMDAFFAAVEQLDDPTLRGRPVLVGGSPAGRGVVSTASYEARPFGCRSAMPMATALRLCPHAVVVPPRFERYSAISHQVHAIFESFTPLVEPLSIDEAFLDVTGSARLFGDGAAIGRRLKQRIFAETRLTASVGVAPNKFLAKLASDLRKPDGLVCVPPDGVQAFLDPLPIERLWGAGRVTQRRLDRLGIRTFGDLRQRSLASLRHEFGDTGEHFHRLVRGLDDRPVIPDHDAKSISHEQTFAHDAADRAFLRFVLLHQTERVAERLRRSGRKARTVCVKIRTPDFATVTRRTTLEFATDETERIWAAVAELFAHWAAEHEAPVRLIGAGVTQITDGRGSQLPLFERELSDRRRRLDRTMDEIRRRFGRGAISRGGPVGE